MNNLVQKNRDTIATVITASAFTLGATAIVTVILLTLASPLIVIKHLKN